MYMVALSMRLCRNNSLVNHECFWERRTPTLYVSIQRYSCCWVWVSNHSEAPFKIITSSVLLFYVYSLVDISKQWAILGTGFRTALPSKADLVANNRRTTQKFSQLLVFDSGTAETELAVMSPPFKCAAVLCAHFADSRPKPFKPDDPVDHSRQLLHLSRTQKGWDIKIGICFVSCGNLFGPQLVSATAFKRSLARGVNTDGSRSSSSGLLARNFQMVYV